MAQVMAPGILQAWRREAQYPDGEDIISKCSAPRSVTAGGSQGAGPGVKGPKWLLGGAARSRMGNRDGGSDSGQGDILTPCLQRTTLS